MADWPPLRDYRRSVAVVIGTWDYVFLDRVPAAKHSLRRMERLLAGPLCGWPRDRMLVLPNVPSPGDLPDQLITAFDDVTDVAVFYFVGHGQIAPDDQLCLGLAQSRPEPNRRAATSLRFADVRQALQDSRAAVKIVILDCCFAGLATKGAMAGDVLLDLTAGTGAYTMAATSAYATAWYQDEPGLATPQTYFTKYLADLVEEGIPGQPALLRIDPLFKRLRDNLAADGRPVPHSRAVNDAREFIFAYNAAPPATHRDPEQELARLGRQLAETETRWWTADAQVSALKAEAADRERELARLRERLASPGSHDDGQQRELQHAIDEAARQLDATRAAQAALTTARPGQLAPTDGKSSRPTRPGTSDPARSKPGKQASRHRQARQYSKTRPQQQVSADRPATSPPERMMHHTPVAGPGVPPGSADVLTASRRIQSGPGSRDDRQRPVRSLRRRLLVIALPCVILVAAVAVPLGFLAGLGGPPTPNPSHTAAKLSDPASKGVYGVAFGPGGILAAADNNGKIYLWDTATRKITAALPDPASEGVYGVAFGPGGILAAADNNGKIYLWDTATRKISATFPEPSGGPHVSGVAFGPGGILAAVYGNGNTYLWDTTTRKITTLPDPHSSGALGVAFGPGGILAVADGNGNTYLWDTTTRKIAVSLPDPDRKPVFRVAFGPGSILAAGDLSGKIYLWDTVTGKITAALSDSGSGGLTFVAFGLGGILAAAVSNGNTYLWHS
jgi:hypothetical protein